MRKLEVKDADIIHLAVQDEIVRSEEARYDHRLHGILLVTGGFSCSQVAELFGHSPRTVHSWVRRFEENGFAGLRETSRPGRPTALGEVVRHAIGEDLRRSPFEFGYTHNLWDGKLLSHYLTERYEVDLGVRQCQRLFHHLGLRQRKPRPLIAKSDPEAQRKYKKTKSPHPKR